MVENWKNIRLSGYFCDNVYIKTAGNKGMGVFARRDILAGSVIEYCYCMVLGFRENYHKDPVLFQYCYPGDDEVSDEWSKHGRKFLIPLGFGSVYNSSDSELNSNAVFKTNTNEKLITFVASKDIKKDSEILVWWSQAYYDYFCCKK